MGDEAEKARAREVANLQLEMAALTSKLNAASLPEALRSVRRTIFWSALGISFALLLNGVFHLWETPRIDRLEERVQQLERTQTSSPSPSPH